MAALRTEYAVVGGGVTGLSAAWALARRGREVTVLDQAAVGHRDGGSHGACRIFRLGYDDPWYVSLAARAAGLWSALERACGERLLHPTPQVTFGPRMPQVRQAMREAGAPCEVIGAREAGRRFPGLAVPGDVLVEPESAVIAADRALAALAALIPPAGQVLTGTRVTALADDGRRVRIATTESDIEADGVIVCAGPWTARLAGTAGITVPGAATLEQVAYLAPRADGPPVPAPAGGSRGVVPPWPALPIFVHYGGEFPYGLPVPGSDRYKIGLHHGGPPADPDRQDHGIDEDLAARIEQAAGMFLPGFDPRPAAAERCVYDNSPDTDFIVDRVGRIVIGSGTSGHGFKFGPLLGEWLATLAAGDGGDGPPARFALGRF